MRTQWAIGVALLAILAGCAAPHAEGNSRTVIRLEATLVSPTDIALAWHGDEAGRTGRVVEFATEPDGPYTILEFVPPSRTTFTHSDLMPETPFYYRVRPVLGPASGWVEVALPDGPLTEEAAREDHEWAAPRVLPGGPAAIASVRDGRAAPTNVTAIVKHANGIAFTWTDNATDEEGYLIEVQPKGSQDFRVAAVVDPNVNSTGLITLPDEKLASYRIRSFYYGQSSNVAHQRTGNN